MCMVSYDRPQPVPVLGALSCILSCPPSGASVSPPSGALWGTRGSWHSPPCHSYGISGVCEALLLSPLSLNTLRSRCASSFSVPAQRVLSHFVDSLSPSLTILPSELLAAQPSIAAPLRWTPWCIGTCWLVSRTLISLSTYLRNSRTCFQNLLHSLGSLWAGQMGPMLMGVLASTFHTLPPTRAGHLTPGALMNLSGRHLVPLLALSLHAPCGPGEHTSHTVNCREYQPSLAGPMRISMQELELVGWTSLRMSALLPVFSYLWGSQSLGGYSTTLARVLSELQAKSA